ncbi:23068_t:CDS:2, partial [Racocetra persica]
NEYQNIKSISFCSGLTHLNKYAFPYFSKVYSEWTIRKKTDERINRITKENDRLKRKLNVRGNNKEIYSSDEGNTENNNDDNLESRFKAVKNSTKKLYLGNDTGLKAGDIYTIGEIIDEVNPVTGFYVLRAQITNKTYGITTWVKFTNFEVFFDILIPPNHPNPKEYCNILIKTMEYTNARHPNSTWVKMTSLIKDYPIVKRNDGKEYLRIRFTDHSKRRSVIQAIYQDKFKSYTICEDSLSGFFILKDEAHVLLIDEYENCLKYDKDVIFLDDDFFCNEIVYAFDLKTTFLQNFNHEIKKKDMIGRGSTPFDRAYMNISVFTQGNDPVLLGVICLLDTRTDTPLRYESEEKIKERIWKIVNDITKFQKVDPETIKTMVNFSEKNYEEMVKAFAKIQNNIKSHVIIGNNSNGFDMPFIMQRLEWLGSTMIEEFYRIATDAIEYTYIKFDGTLFWDSMTIFQREFSGRQSSLNYMLDTLEIPSKIGLSYRRIDKIVSLAIEMAKIQDKITKLNIDLMDYHNKIEELNSRQDAMIYNCEYVQPFRDGKTSMLNCLIAKKYNKEHNDKPVSYSIKDKKKFQGAEVIDLETGYYMDLIYVLDFASLYLSIIREYNIGPDTLRYKKPNEKHRVVHLIDNNVRTNQDIYFIHEDTQESIIRNILMDLIKKKKEAKKERDKYIGSNDVMYNILDQKQLAYKASANALYGGLGSPYLGIAIPVISQCITFVARELCGYET